MQNWKTAAQAYQKNAERQRQQTTSLLPARKEQEERERQDMAELMQAVTDLQQFIANDGPAALELLSASKRHIILGENNDGGGMTTVYFLGDKGLQMSVEPSGTRLAYMKEIPAAKIRDISVIETVTAATTLGCKNSQELVAWIRDELDKIAAAAPAVE